MLLFYSLRRFSSTGICLKNYSHFNSLCTKIKYITFCLQFLYVYWWFVFHSTNVESLFLSICTRDSYWFQQSRSVMSCLFSSSILPIRLIIYFCRLPRRCSSFSKYSGNGASNSMYSPVRGWINPNVLAWSVCPVRWNGHFWGPYTWSPKIGCPILAMCTRIWWVRPVSSWHSTYVY